MKEAWTLKTIAYIHTDFPTKFGVPRQSGLADTKGKIVFENEDYDKIKKHTSEKAVHYKHSDNCLSAKSKKLLKLIGKPINLTLPKSLTNVELKQLVIKSICYQPYHDTIELTTGFLHFSYPIDYCKIVLDKIAQNKLKISTYGNEEENDNI